MKEVKLETGYGVVWEDGKIKRRINLPAGNHEFRDDESVTEYDTFEEVIDLNWPPELSVSSNKTQIVNDGQDTATISIDVKSEYDDTWVGELVIDGTSFAQTYSNTSTVTKEITTQKSSGSMITIEAKSDNDLISDTIEIEVVSQ